MRETIVVRAERRTASGSAAARRLRRAGRIPAIVYSEGRRGEPVWLNAHDFGLMLQHHRGEHMLLSLELDGARRSVLLKEVQHHPLNSSVVHVDFYEVSLTRRIRVEVPLRLVGDPIGVTQQGGILDHLLRSVVIECLPSDIPEEIQVDVSALAVGRHMNVGDIQLDGARYRMITAPDIAIAAVSMPKTEEAPAAAVAAEGETVEPEVLTARKGEAGDEGSAKDEAKAAPAAAKESKEGAVKSGKGAKG